MVKLLIEIGEIIRELIDICKEKNVKRCFIQIPEGLLRYAHEISKALINNGFEGIVSIDPCFGACDIPYWKAKVLNCDVIIHIGHSPIPSVLVPMDVEYVEVLYDLEMNESLLNNLYEYLTNIGIKSVGLVGTVQYIKMIPKVADYLTNRGIKVFIGKASGRAKYDGQILGCNVSTAMSVLKDVEAYVFVGDGLFHPIAVYLSTKKDVIAFNPITGEIRSVKDQAEKIMRIRAIHMVEASNARSFSVIVTSKIGQYNETLLKTALELLKKYEREYSIIHEENISDAINYLEDVDAYVVIGCPRVVYDDYLKFKKPVLTVNELKAALSRDFDNWRFLELP